MSEGLKLDDLENVLSERRMSQADLARRSGLSPHTIGRAVRDGEKVSSHSARKIAGALRVGVSSLCGSRTGGASEARETPGAETSGVVHIDPGRIRNAMAGKGMNPTELASRAGLSVATVSSAIRGVRTPRKETIEKIAKAVGEDVGSPESARPVAESSRGELRLRPGQSNAVLYPEELPEAASGTPAAEAGPVGETLPTIITMPRVNIHGSTGRSEDEGAENLSYESSWSALLNLRAHVLQSRQMLTAVLEHVGNLEEQIERTISSSSQSRDGAW